MQSALERIAQLNQESSQVSRRIALAACESFDEWLRAQMDANRELVQGHAVGLAGLRESVALAKLPVAYLRYWQRIVENAGDWVEAGVKTQATFAKILFEQANAASTAIRQIAEEPAVGAVAASEAAHQRPREKPRQAA